MTAATVSQWARRYVLTSVLFLVAWQVGIVVGIPRHAEVVLGIYGFVLHKVFGKAYSLIPTYFDRELVYSYAPTVQFPFVVAGTGGLTGAALQIGPTWLGLVGALLWSLGVGVFLGTFFWTIRSNLTGRNTATGEANADRKPTDRLANGFVPIALGYLILGTYETLAIYTRLPLLFDGYFPRVTHLLAAGTAGLLIFALGFRLLPRFMVASPPRPLVALVLPAGALGPILLATHLGNNPWFQLGALIEATAVTGFALGSGLWLAFNQQSSSLVLAHLRLNLLGFLGLTIIGIAYQFYPPDVGAFPGASNRTAFISIASLVQGVEDAVRPR